MLFANRLDVQSAQLFHRDRDGAREVVDVFVVRRLDEDPGGLTRLAAKLPRDLASVLESDALLDRIAAHRSHQGIPRKEPAVRTEVEVDNHASESCTVIEVFGRDRPGFLFSVARALYDLGLSIALAKVNTEGRRVADVFYVTETSGAKVAAERFGEIEERLVAAVK
jgi:[protein-PII] uridylyltransferase